MKTKQTAVAILAVSTLFSAAFANRADAAVVVSIYPNGAAGTLIGVSGSLPSLLARQASNGFSWVPLTVLSLGNNDRFGFVSSNTNWDVHGWSGNTLNDSLSITGSFTDLPANLELAVEVTPGFVLGFLEDELHVPGGSDATFTINQTFSSSQDISSWAVEGESITYSWTNVNGVSDSMTFQIIPEPSSALLLGLGAMGFMLRRRRTNGW